LKKCPETFPEESNERGKQTQQLGTTPSRSMSFFEYTNRAKTQWNLKTKRTNKKKKSNFPLENHSMSEQNKETLDKNEKNKLLPSNRPFFF
jgi:hypothetical protein